MNLFFVALKKRGVISAHEQDEIINTVKEGVSIRTHLTHVETRSISADALLVCVGNEPESPIFYEADDSIVSVCGFLLDRRSTITLRPSEHLSDEITKIHGRFSAITANPRTGEFAMAVPAARVDAIFTAETNDFKFWGNQASVVGDLRNGSIVYSVPALFDLINAGFYGSDATPYEGVTALPARTTVYRSSTRGQFGATLRVRSKPLWEYKQKPADLDECAEHLTGAFSHLPLDFPLVVALTGGRDSRLVLAAALKANVEVKTRTQLKDTNSADVWLAQRLAEAAGIEHEIHTKPSGGSKSELLVATKANLFASDGMLAFPYLVTHHSKFLPGLSLNGLGGETLRAGYAENIENPTWRDAIRAYKSLFGRNKSIFKLRYRYQLAQRIAEWLWDFPWKSDPGDIMDCLYVDVRCGRWVSASSCGKSRKFMPLLDNRFTASILSLPASYKRSEQVYIELFKRLRPDFLDLPLAATHWKADPKKRRLEFEQRFPQAFVKPSKSPATGDHFFEDRRRYTLERLDLFSEILDLDAARRSLTTATPSVADMRLAQRAHAAAVLLSEKWR
jgi:asparagine synthetase B (glutamine-hydrolysing)